LRVRPEGPRPPERRPAPLELPFPDGAFDVVWTQNSGMSIADKERLHAGFHRVLRPGGVLAFQEPMAGTGLARAHVRLGEVDDGHAAAVLHREGACRTAEPTADVEDARVRGRGDHASEPLGRRLAAPVKLVGDGDVVDVERGQILAGGARASRMV
jgi:SAM-dependent methyltransferase